MLTTQSRTQAKSRPFTATLHLFPLYPLIGNVNKLKNQMECAKIRVLQQNLLTRKISYKVIKKNLVYM
jgi:hypothetical protein